MTTTSLKATDTGPALRLLSLGAGVQSTTVLLLACEGEIPRFDVALFADTGWEPRAVYANLDRLAAHAERHGIPVRQVSAGNIRRLSRYTSLSRITLPRVPNATMGTAVSL